MATPKKTIVASPKKRAVVSRIERKSTRIDEKKRVPRKKVAKDPVGNFTPSDIETVIAPPLKVKRVPKEEVKLPANASLRSKDKVRAITDVLENLERPFFVISYVSAACFFAVGLSLIASNYLKGTDLQVAQLLTSSSTISGVINIEAGDSGTSASGSAGGTANSVTQVLNLVPTFELMEPLPSTIDNDARITVYVANASQVQVKAYSKNSTKSYELPSERVSNTNWRFTVPAKILPSGEYYIRLQATSENGSGVHAFTVGSFVRQEQQTTTSNTNTTTSNLPDANDSAESPTSDEDAVVDSDEEQLDTTLSSTTAPITTIVPETTARFEVIPPTSPLSDFEAVRIFAPEGYSEIEVYVRPALSTQQIFVGSAFYNDNRWSLAFNTNNLPNGAYQMHAVSTYKTQRIYSKAVGISVYNRVVTVNDKEPAKITPASEPEALLKEKVASTSSSVERSFYSYEEDTTFVPTGEETEEAESATVTLLESEQGEINELLKSYAVASQSDSDLLKHSLNQDFDAVRQEIIRKVLEDDSNSELVEQIDSALSARFDELKKRVDSFEELRSSRTNSNIANDSDKDGVSDFDETEVYGTDPQNPDTDNDGFLDGVEVIRGFDPKDAKSEAVVEFELPQTTVGLARKDILVVHEVRPIIENDQTLETPKVQTEIIGKGLPNSFVTLYIFSTPTIVTIKTDVDGSFTYTFDKELEDGEHEVYAAFTDNTGSIMAHSEPFRFVKEAEAFTPVGAAENELVTAPSFIENSRSEQTNTVIGLGILALGIILLMLGMSIRPNKVEVEQVST